MAKRRNIRIIPHPRSEPDLDRIVMALLATLDRSHGDAADDARTVTVAPEAKAS